MICTLGECILVSLELSLKHQRFQVGESLGVCIWVYQHVIRFTIFGPSSLPYIELCVIQYFEIIRPDYTRKTRDQTNRITQFLQTAGRLRSTFWFSSSQWLPLNTNRFHLFGIEHRHTWQHNWHHLQIMQEKTLLLYEAVKQVITHSMSPNFNESYPYENYFIWGWL